MDKKIIAELKEKLETEKKSIQTELESFASKDPNSKDNWDTRYPNREDGDKDDEADEVGEYENMLSVEHNLEVRLRDINSALEKIEKGGYGICENCGKEIDQERLQALPEAKTCLKCNNKA
jgi:DnaK suppressor protein